MRRLRRIFTAPVRPIGPPAARPAPPASTGALVAVRWPHSRLCACGCRRG